MSIRKAVGVVHTVNARADDLIEQITAICGGDLPTTIFEATGEWRCNK